jgi:hypothetical protein
MRSAVSRASRLRLRLRLRRRRWRPAGRRGAAGPEDTVAEEPACDLVQPGLGNLDGTGMIRAGGGHVRVGGVVRACVVDQRVLPGRP